MKRRIHLLLFLLSFSIQAHDDCEDPHEFSELQRYLSWNSASSEEIQNAPCKTKIPEYKIDPSPGNQSADIHGVTFTNERPELLLAFKKLTTMRDTFGHKEEPSAQVQIQNRYTINPSCVKVLCAVAKIWEKRWEKKFFFSRPLST